MFRRSRDTMNFSTETGNNYAHCSKKKNKTIYLSMWRGINLVLKPEAFHNNRQIKGKIN